jgi:SAM-dependent methyltransferase
MEDSGVLTPEGPNADQIEYWNSDAGRKWVALHELIDLQIRPLGERVMERGGIGTGQRAVDIGCGCGDSSAAIGERVGPRGEVLGVDISTLMLERARQRAAERGLHHVHFVNVDAQTHRLPEGGFDVVFSRFGVMFFRDPDHAFANFRAALRPGGRLAFVCWQALPENPWMFVPLMAALQHIAPPPIPAPDAPGPFAFADPERVRGILTRAGFDDIELESARETLTVGGGKPVAETAEFVLQMGPTARLLRQSGDESLLQKVKAAVHEALEPYASATGVRMPSAAWIVTARRG